MPFYMYIIILLWLIVIFYAAYLVNRRNRLLSVKHLKELKQKNDSASQEEVSKLCPICGFPVYKQLGIKPWEGDSPSDEICPGCGIQFGHQDYADGDRNKREEVRKILREQFLKKGKTYENLMKKQREKMEKARNLKQD